MMNTKLFKRIPLVALIALPCYVMAAPTVTFQGEVSTQTCKVEINGQTNAVVMMPTVALTDFGSPIAPGETAGETAFTVLVTDCTAPTEADQDIATQFLGYDVDSPTGVLGNTISGGATGFGIQLLSDATDQAIPVVLSGITPVAGLVLPVGQTSASHEFGARYYALSATGGAGKITAVAEYSLSYF